MANPKHVELLRGDVDAWNEWRDANPGAKPDLSYADLSSADLTLANLADAVLTGASLTLANLRAADLRGADLSDANLLGARLLGVDLVGANVRGANLFTAEDLTREQLEETLGDERTVLPDDIERPAHWVSIKKVNLSEAFASFSDHWWPRIVGDVNDMHVKVVKLLGDFVWHQHEDEDELFLVVRGRMLMRFRDRDVMVEEGEFIVVPAGVEHQTVAERECHVVLFEPKSTVNTGNVTNERTATRLDRIV
jgi:mannose-6-phosphate isomerase-like protein (cupin superfamily)